MAWDFFEGQEPCQTTSECRNVGTRETILTGFYQDILMCGRPVPLALLVPRTGSTSWGLHSSADPRCSLRIHPNTLQKATHPHARTRQLKSNQSRHGAKPSTLEQALHWQGPSATPPGLRKSVCHQLPTAHLLKMSSGPPCLAPSDQTTRSPSEETPVNLQQGTRAPSFPPTSKILCKCQIKRSIPLFENER